MALSGAAGHHPQIVIPIALGQLGREEVGIALADQLGRGEGEIVRQQPVAGDEDGAGVFEQHPIGQLIHHLAKQGSGLRGKGGGGLELISFCLGQRGQSDNPPATRRSRR